MARLENIIKFGREFSKSRTGYIYDYADKTGLHLFFLLQELIIVDENTVGGNKVTIYIDTPKKYKEERTIEIKKLREFILNEIKKEDRFYEQPKGPVML